MTAQEKNLFAIAYLSIALLAIGFIAPMFTVVEGGNVIFLISVGMIGLGLAIYRLNRIARPTCTQVGATRFVLKRPYPLRDRFRDFRQAIRDRLDAFRANHPIAYAVTDGVLVIIMLGIFLASLTLILVGMSDRYDPPV